MRINALLVACFTIKRKHRTVRGFHYLIPKLDFQANGRHCFQSTWIATTTSLPRWNQCRIGNVRRTEVLQTRKMTSNKALNGGRKDTRTSVHILGVGNIGKLIAHALALENQPPHITLLLRRVGLVEKWETGGRVIEIITDGTSSKSSGYEIEVQADSARGKLIENLIVATKATNTSAAILAIRSRLGPNSTILFAQNGLGILDEVNHKVFPDSATRPQYLACVVTHGAYSQGPFTSVHAGIGNIAIGSVVSTNATCSEESRQRDLVDIMLRAPILSAREVSADELFRLQVEKLVINAMINPLTVIFNRRNGELFSNNKILELMRLLLEEVTSVISSLPEIENKSAIRERFSTSRLERIVLDVAEKTSKNMSSMLQDVNAARPTEIDYINGYIVYRGSQIGINCTHNRTLIRLVKETRTIGEDEIDHFF